MYLALDAKIYLARTYTAVTAISGTHQHELKMVRIVP